MTYKYKVSGLKGSVVYTDFQDNVSVEIAAKKISEATEKIRQYLTDNFLHTDKIVLTSIKFT